MGEDTETMSHFTLPANTVSETITFTAPNAENQNQLPLTVHMHFGSDSTGVLRMTGYGVNSNFSDGLEIIDNRRALTTLTLKLANDWPDSGPWSITVDSISSGQPDQRLPYTLSTVDDALVISNILPTEDLEKISLTITHTPQGGNKLETGDPKIKVIRPTA